MGLSASLSRPGSAGARSFPAKPVERGGKFVAKFRIIALDALGAADHYMVGARKPFSRDDLAGDGAQAALHPVANDGSADLFGNGEPDAHAQVRIFAVADEQDETGSRRTTAAIRS
jgi:hypothetical protein